MARANPVRQFPSVVTHEVQLLKCGLPDLLPLSNWVDSNMRYDVFLPRRQLEEILKRPTSTVFAVVVDDVMGGLAIIYRGSTLHNLFLSAAFRRGGLGSAILRHLRPTNIRSKSNMTTGDPTPFYVRNGYRIVQRDAARPHIVELTRDVKGRQKSWR